jgi:tetratricopeptide (TPR) repeat protein
LRTGYGYSLRRVEERARAEGGELDNSQLSRYEKGICYPSFDKLRILASVFNVSIQSFSDVVDLESFEDLKPESGDPAELIADGLSAMNAGNTGLAFALFERALEILQENPDPLAGSEMIAQARINQAAALIRLGKLSLAEHELRTALKAPGFLSVKLQARALLSLANVHAEQGDLLLAELEADRAYSMAEDEGLDLLAARALHHIGFALSQRGAYLQAIEKYRLAANLYGQLEQPTEAMRLRINIGNCYAALGKHRESVRLLKTALDECRSQGHRRLEALAWSNLGEAYFKQGDIERAQQCFRNSDSVLRTAENQHTDILFLNAFYDWKIARNAENPTGAKIAFGRLKVLRSSIEKRFPEVDVFDAYVERGRSHA